MEIIAGNAFRPDNNVEIAYADQNGISYKRYHEFLGSFMRDFVSMELLERTEKLQRQVCCLMSCLISQILAS